MMNRNGGPGRNRSLGGRRPTVVAVVAALLMTVVPVSLIGTTAAGAAPGDATAQLTTKNVSVAEAEGGDVITYSVTFTCSNSLGGSPPDGCDGAQFSDPLPTFTDIYGNVVPVEFVEASGPATVWPTGFTLDESTDPPTVRGTAGSWPAGTSGVITISVRVPPNVVPVDPQTLTNTATVTDPERPGYSDDSTTAETVISATEPDWTVTKQGPSDDGLRMDMPYTWIIWVCPDAPTSAAFPIYDITDTLPSGFEYLSSDPAGVYTDDNVPPEPADDISDGAATVTWHFDADNPPPFEANGCIRLEVIGQFPSGYPSNVEGAEKTNVADGTGQYTPEDPPTDLGDDSWTNDLLGPQFGGVTMFKQFTDPVGTSAYYVTTGDTVRVNLSATVDSDFLLDTVTLQDGTWEFDDGTVTSGDGFPESFEPTRVTPGIWNDPVTATIQWSNDGSTWFDVATGVASGASMIDLPAGTQRFIRWVWANPGAIRGDFSARGQQILGVIGEPKDDLGHYFNTATTTVTRADAEPAVVSYTDDYLYETPQPDPGIDKTVANVTRQPGQTTSFGIVVSNSLDATGDLVNPVVEDCVPEWLVVQTPIALPTGWSQGAPPTCEIGETPLRFEYSGTLAPGAVTPQIVINIKVAGPGNVEIPAPYDQYVNTAYVHPEGGGQFGHCRNTSPVCGDSATLTVPPTVQLDSAKCVRGELDGGVFRPTPRCTPGEPAVVAAQTVPGGAIDYRLTVHNVGNTDATDVDFIDILPHLDDTAVISGDPLNPRRSEYRPLLLTPITAPEGWTISYSTSDNPCRPEVGGPTTGCDDPEWTTTPNPLALGAYQSVKFHYEELLPRGATGTFTWSMRAPVLTPAYDEGGSDDGDPFEFLRTCDADASESDPTHCPRAVNSFAYGADAGNLPSQIPAPGRLFAEPTQVEVRVVEPPHANAIGDLVFYDRNFNGLQDADEDGIAGVRVALHVGDVAIATAFTDDAGAYLFNTLGANVPIPDGTYTVRFYPEAGWYVSPQDVTGVAIDVGAPGGPNPGTNTDDDSDLPQIPTGTDLILGPYVETVSIQLGNNPNVNLGLPDVGETDPTWDLGLWRAEPAIEIDKVTKDTAWPDSEYGDGVAILPERPVTWRYTITNTGNTRLEDVQVSDDDGTAGSTGDDFAVTNCMITDDGENAEGLVSSATAPIALNRGASMVCTATGTAIEGDYDNVGSVEGHPVTDGGDDVDDAPPGYPTVADEVTDTDPSSYVNARYDLALAKTVGPLDLATGTATFTITVENQGTVDSGNFTVTDALSPGLSVGPTSTTPSASTTTGSSATGVGLTWDLGNLVPGAQRTITIEVHVEDYTTRPWRNTAEISADSSALVQTGGVSTPTSDIDSTPDTDLSNDGDYGPIGDSSDVDNASIADAGVDPDPEDDADIADLDPALTYDLALAKTAAATPATQTDHGTVTYTITVQNQGTVDSGTYTVTDVVPAGLTVDDAHGGVVSPQGDGTTTVVYTGTNLVPGGLATFTIDATATDLTRQPYRNVAEISADSADALYRLSDVDSTPDTDPDNDGDYGPVGDPSDVDNLDIAEAGIDPDPEDDADIADVDFAVSYDLALAKTVASPVVEGNGTIGYTVTVQNQGIVDSRQFVVTDAVPAGLAVVAGAVSDSGVVSLDGTRVTWTIANLEPATTKDLTFDAVVTDYSLRPYRNIAEISSDSADDYSTPGNPVTDVDSTPDLDPDNDGDYGPVGNSSDVDNAGIADAGVDPDPEDDADVADVAIHVVYDLAIAKRVTKSGPYRVGDVVPYEVAVTNQGNVPSGIYSFTDTLPPGMAFVSASDGGTASGQVVTWSNQPSLAPGETHAVTVSARIVDGSYGQYRNWVQITEDSADTYDTPDEDISDIDSVTGDGERGEDDDANAVITVEPEGPDDDTSDTGTPPQPPGTLPVTGSDAVRLVAFGALLLAAGSALVVVTRRRHASR